MIIGMRMRRWLSLLVIVGVMVWAAWLLSRGKSKLDYVAENARKQLPLAACEWVPIDAPAVAALGLSFEPSHAWTDRKEAMLAFRTGSVGGALAVKLQVISIAGAGVSISADGGKSMALQDPGEFSLPLRSPRAGNVHTVSIKVARPQPPQGQDRRWLGVAISAIHVCGVNGAKGN